MKKTPNKRKTVDLVADTVTLDITNIDLIQWEQIERFLRSYGIKIYTTFEVNQLYPEEE